MYHFLPFIIIILILIKNIKNNSDGKQKRIKPKSFIILPILIIIYIYGIFRTSSYLPKYYYLIFIVAIILGSLIGYNRSKSYSFTINADGDVFYKKEIYDSVILIILLLIEGLIRYVFKTYEQSLFILANISLIILGTSSIAVRKIAMFIKYKKIKKNL